MPSDDFMADITQRLNIESAKMINIQQQDSPKGKKTFLQNLSIEPATLRQQEEAKLKSKGPTALEITSQLFHFPHFKGKIDPLGSLKNDGPIPGLNPIHMSDNF